MARKSWTIVILNGDNSSVLHEAIIVERTLTIATRGAHKYHQSLIKKRKVSTDSHFTLVGRKMSVRPFGIYPYNNGKVDRHAIESGKAKSQRLCGTKK